MNWTQKKVEKILNDKNAFNMFIKQGFLRLQVNNVSLLFFPNTNDTVSLYYEYLLPKTEFIEIEKFCSYAIQYLQKHLSQYTKTNLFSLHCIKPINID